MGYCLTASAQQSFDAETETLVLQVAPTLRGRGFDATDDGTGKGTPIIPVAHPLTAGMAASANRMPHEQGALIPVAFNSREDPEVTWDRAGPLGASLPQAQAVAYSIQAGALRENPDAGPDGVGVQEGHAYTLEARAEVQAIAFAQNQRDEVREMAVAGALASEPGMKQQTYLAYDMRGREGGAQLEGPHDTANLRASDGGSSRSYVAQPWAVRRLTPVECERLMDFPDGFTAIPWRKKPASACPDGPRYKALGNSWAVNVAEWVGERIAIVDAWPENETRAARPTNGDPHAND